MPNDGRAPGCIGATAGQSKAAATKRINILRGTPRVPVRQRDYYEHVIRAEDELNDSRQCIANNPAAWETEE
ncbi:MAG TPA: transposase, partial [Anaerolineae bacterium]|nr:transposase [Anaerolineae bacterium]